MKIFSKKNTVSVSHFLNQLALLNLSTGSELHLFYGAVEYVTINLGLRSESAFASKST